MTKLVAINSFVSRKLFCIYARYDTLLSVLPDAFRQWLHQEHKFIIHRKDYLSLYLMIISSTDVLRLYATMSMKQHKLMIASFKP